MRKRLSIALAAGALVAAMLPGVASATSQPGGCQRGFDQYPVGVLGNSADWPKYDKNDDGQICALRLVLAQSFPDGYYVFTDNVVR
jgi:hypothetical protein